MKERRYKCRWLILLFSILGGMAAGCIRSETENIQCGNKSGLQITMRGIEVQEPGASELPKWENYIAKLRMIVIRDGKIILNRLLADDALKSLNQDKDGNIIYNFSNDNITFRTGETISLYAVANEQESLNLDSFTENSNIDNLKNTTIQLENAQTTIDGSSLIISSAVRENFLLMEENENITIELERLMAKVEVKVVEKKEPDTPITDNITVTFTYQPYSSYGLFSAGKNEGPEGEAKNFEGTYGYFPACRVSNMTVTVDEKKYVADNNSTWDIHRNEHVIFKAIKPSEPPKPLLIRVGVSPWREKALEPEYK